ncbi:MAG: hypothetical protein AB7I09_20370 [Planctomycetota bacterium]
MPHERDILDQLPDLLEELAGVRPERVEFCPPSGADSVLQLAGRVLVVEAKANARSGVLAEAAREVVSKAREHGSDAVPLLVVPYMGDVGRRICEEAGVAYVDLSGNADIKAPPLVIRVAGRPNRFKQRGRPSSVFAPKSSRVARLLLLEPERWWSQHELAERGDLGPGYVSRICGRLDDEKLIERNADRELRPRDPKLLLRAWQEEYSFEKHEIMRGHVSARSGDELAGRITDALQRHGVHHAFTGLVSAWALAPFAGYRLVSVYVAKRVVNSVLDSLKWHEGSKGANLWLVRPNDEGVFQGESTVKGINCVSAIQTYLDLHGMPERSDEAAAHLREKLLPWA